MKQVIIAASLALAIFTSCKKSTGTQQQTSSSSRLTKVEHANDYSEISYNSDGTVKGIDTKNNNGSVITSFNIVYEAGKVKYASYGTVKLNYTYTGGLVTKVEAQNPTGNITNRVTFSYINTQLQEIIEYKPSGSNLVAFAKTKYTYTNTGNPSLIEEFEYINNAWKKMGDIAYTSFDNKSNSISNFEQFTYLPGVNFSVNNPLQEVHRNELGNIMQTIKHVYTYDNSGKPTQRVSTTKIPGMADIIETTKFHY